MGRVFRIKDIWYIEYYLNGRQIRRSTRQKLKGKAVAELIKVENEILDGIDPLYRYSTVTFDRVASELIGDYKDRGLRSVKRVEQCIANLRRFFGHIDPNRITTQSVREYREHRLEDGLSIATVNRELSALKRMLRLGYQHEPKLIRSVPYIPTSKEDNARAGFFERQEFLKLRKALPDYLQGFVTFAYKTGWRRAEITGLTWEQVDRKEWSVRLGAADSKNREGRVVYLDNELREIFRELFKNRRLDCPYVFSREGRRIGDTRFPWREACRRAGVPGRLFHDLRRTAVRNMIRAGVPERIVMQITGHKTRSVFDRYNITSGEDLREAAKKQEEFLT